MTTETGAFTPTDEDVERAVSDLRLSEPDPTGERATEYEDHARTVLATIGPIIERERRAAKVEAALRGIAVGYRLGLVKRPEIERDA